MPESDPYGAKVLTDAMQAKKAFGPSAAAMANAVRAVGPSASAVAKMADVFDTIRPGAKLAEAMKPIGGSAQHGALAEMMAGVKPIGTVAGAAENLRRATDGFAHPFRSAGMMDSTTGRSLTDVLTERARPSSDRQVPRFEPPPNYTAELLGHQRQTERRRAEERAIEDAWREQSLAVQRASHAALLESEAARAADAEAAALREQALVDRAESAEARAEASDKRQAKMLRVAVIGVGIGVLAPAAQIILTLI